MKKIFYFFKLEIALKSTEDSNIYAFENVSHIPTKKIIEIFNINLKKDPHLLQGYFLTKSSYKKHKKYIRENIGVLNLDVFEYCLRQYVTSDVQRIRRLYKEDLME